MTCCIVGLLIFAVVGRVRRAFGGGASDATTLFAPVAQWPGPGQTVSATTAAGADTDRRPKTSAVFGYGALGIAICLIATPMLVWSGVVENTGSPAIWLLRSSGYVALIVVMIKLSRSATILRAHRGAGTLLVVVGAVIFELGVVDMHVFRLFEIHHHHGNSLGDLAFHNFGPALMVIGSLVLLYGAAGRSRTSRRSSSSTVTSAQPPSSAVTVSSTAPVTT
ncbi:MAG: hypothetical protein K0U69_15820 [Actinomycetia bacterium]|nr:hypothetical protein [Actinomycetes bacterium]MCH9710963.1 hypothetical protein [Actinomycetes bacterium]